MTTAYKKLCMAMKDDEEFKAIMKEHFIQKKIEEAKKKKVGNQEGSLWDLLPPEIEQKIMLLKKKDDNMLEIGDYVMKTWYNHRKKQTRDDIGFYRIIGETKTQYRVEKITHQVQREWGAYQRSTYHTYIIPRDVRKHTYTKHKNIQKAEVMKGNVVIVRSCEDSKFEKYEEDGANWIFTNHDLWGAR